jgi:WbqC-like protein family
MKRVAVVQSNYIPWKGYFDLIAAVEEFILLDDVQYTRRDWRNRNKIKTAQGLKWLTIPVQVKGRYHQRIDETLIDDPDWAETHWQTIRHAYAGAECFERFAPAVERLYTEARSERLSEVNRFFLEGICDILGIETKLSWSTDYGAEGVKGERLLELCLKAGADEYVSGPSARAYLDERPFAEAGVAVDWFDYPAYPSYPQLHPPFEHQVSVIDLVLNAGSDAKRYLRPATRTGARDAT